MKKNVILTKNELDSICARIGKEITEAIKNDEKIPVVVGVLKGALNFTMDLIKYIDAPIYTDYIQIHSYSGTKTTGKVQLLKDLSFDCQDRTVIIVEDIIDTGVSMEFLLKHLKSHSPKQIFVCALFNKKEARKVPVPVDFVGKELTGNDFLIGYGLDYNEICRNLPYIYAATPEDIEELKKIIDKDMNY